ncbi:MAG: hypothetical protein EGP82_00740 [Odoribacter splanchnicus]|nr:hypothetical protein [Odoribacter splanchnicus]
MEGLYHNLKCELKHLLNVFRGKLLLSDLLKGGILISLFIVVYLLLFSFIVHISSITVAVKTAFYFIFITVLFLLGAVFIVYPLFSFFLSFDLKKDLLYNRILKYLPGDNDLFKSLYQLAIHPEKVTGDEELKKAAFIQKYSLLKENKLYLSFPDKLLVQRFIFFAIIFSVLFLNGKNFTRFYEDLSAYENVDNPKFRIDFQLENKSLDVEYGKSVQLRLKVKSDYLDVENVFICYGGGEFLMDKIDSLFVYDFDVVNNDIKFYFKTSGIESRLFKIRVLPTPEITDYKVTYIPPAYTGIKAEVLKNVVDFRVLYGSFLKFELDFSELDSLFLEENGRFSVISLKDKSSAVFTKKIRSSGEFSLYGSNPYFSKKSLFSFTVTCIPDLYPGIQITELQDSLRTSVHYFYGVISDDYGFSDLRFNYSVNGRNTVMPIQIVKNINAQEFYFSFDFSEFAGMDKAQIGYFFEVFDNDVISGPKSTRSDNKNYSVPDLNTIFDYNVQTNTQMNASLNEAEKLAKEIVSDVKELQRKMLDNTVDNWEKQQLSKDIVEKKSKLDKLLNSVKEDNLKKSSLNQSFTRQDSLLTDKQNKIQELLDKIMDEDMKKLMDEFTKLSQEFSKDKFQNLDEKMKLSFDQLSEELDRNIELLKRFQVEEKHDVISKQLDKLKADQQQFEEMMENRSIDRDSLFSFNKKMKNDINSIENNYENLLKDNQELSSPYDLKDQQQKFEELSQQIEKQGQNISEKNKDKGLSKDIEDKIDELREEMEKQKQNNFNNISIPEKDIELIIQNILIISLSQEELLKEFPNVQPQSLRYNELGRLQDLKKQEYKIVKDSLSQLAKSNLVLASILSDKFYDIEIKFGLLSGYIQDNKRSDLSREQQYIVSYLNDMALSLTDALQKSKQNSQGSEGGKGSKPDGDSSGKSKGDQSDGYGQMKKMQSGLKKQLEDLISKMKEGEKGKPLQQGISKMIRENELFRKSLDDFVSESGSLSNEEKQLLNEINRLLEENIRDLANYSVSGHLINRNNQIYNKLIMSEKASKEREEYEEKRKSTSARDERFKKPETMFNFKRKNGAIKTDLYKTDIKLNSYFKNMYNNYYIRLGNE